VRAAAAPAISTADGLTFTEETDGTAALTAISSAAGTSITVPASFTDGGVSYAVTAVDFDSSGADWAMENVAALVLPESITALDSTFNNWTALESFTVPGSVKNFSTAFQRCTALKTLTFAEGVETIDSNSMVTGCTALAAITLPSTLKEIKSAWTFSNASALKEISLPEGVLLDGGGSIGTFSGCASLETMELPASVTRIEDSMFQGCPALKSVTCGAPLTEIGSRAFDGSSEKTADCDTALVSVARKNPSDPLFAPGAKIGAAAFRNAFNLPALDFANVVSIGDYAFDQCGHDSTLAKLAGVNFADCLKTIGDHAFDRCDFTGDLVIPDSVTAIGDCAFWGNIHLRSVKIGSGTESIGAQAFCGNTSLTGVTIGSGIQSIGDCAFSCCFNLKTAVIDTSADRVKLGENVFFESDVQVKYTQPSVKEVGDAICEGGPTLQAAIDSAKPGDVIEIEKAVGLSAPVRVAAGQSVTLHASAAQEIFSTEMENLLVVEKGASLTLDGLDINALKAKNAAVADNGTLVLKSGTIEKAPCAVKVKGEGASFTMDGGSISGNSAETYFTCPGVMVSAPASFTMNGGTISRNAGQTAGAVLVSGWMAKDSAAFTMTGGSIENNTSSSSNQLEAGAVLVVGSASFQLSGGSISGNTAEGSGVGGGVAVIDGTVVGSGADTHIESVGNASFTMDGGTISGNSASAGGGVYCLSNGVVLNAGSITGNHAWMGGGVYSDGQSDSPSGTSYTRPWYYTVRMSNAVVSGNSAAIGGGVWFCPNGGGTFANNFAIFDNTASEAADDVASTPWKNKPSGVTLDDAMVGGGTADWRQDGGVNAGTGLGGGGNAWTASTGASRYGASSAAVKNISGEKGALSLKNIAAENAKTFAGSTAKLFITGNTAVQYGGGIGANGGCEIQGDPLKPVTPPPYNPPVVNPPSDGGEEGGNPPAANVPETPTPLAPAAPVEIPQTQVPETEIPEDPAPTAQAPETGDSAAVWFGLAAASGLGLLLLADLKKKRQKGEL